MKRMIEITNVDMVKLIKKVYDLSVPKGFGYLHFNNNGLTDQEAQCLIKDDGTIHMDYVQGRCCKFTVVRKNGKLFTPYPWFDHTFQQFKTLLDHVGISFPLGLEHEQHSCSCDCTDCRRAKNKHGFDEDEFFSSIF